MPSTNKSAINQAIASQPTTVVPFTGTKPAGADSGQGVVVNLNTVTQLLVTYTDSLGNATVNTKIAVNVVFTGIVTNNTDVVLNRVPGGTVTFFTNTAIAGADTGKSPTSTLGSGSLTLDPNGLVTRVPGALYASVTVPKRTLGAGSYVYASYSGEPVPTVTNSVTGAVQSFPGQYLSPSVSPQFIVPAL